MNTLSSALSETFIIFEGICLKARSLGRGAREQEITEFPRLKWSPLLILRSFLEKDRSAPCSTREEYMARKHCRPPATREKRQETIQQFCSACGKRLYAAYHTARTVSTLAGICRFDTSSASLSKPKLRAISCLVSTRGRGSVGLTAQLHWLGCDC